MTRLAKSAHALWVGERIYVAIPVFDNSYLRLPERFYARVDPMQPPAPRLIAINRNLACELGFDPDWLASREGLDILTGRLIAEGSERWCQSSANQSPLGRAPLIS